MPKKFLDQNGLEYFARKFNDYPDNEILGTVITAIGEELDGKSDVGHTHTAAEVGALPNTTVIPTSTSDLINDSGYLTSYTETDPVFTASAAANISSSDISNWNNKSNLWKVSGSYNDDYEWWNLELDHVALWRLDNAPGSNATIYDIKIPTGSSTYLTLRNSYYQQGKNRVLTFPSTTGTLALTSDIPSVPSWALEPTKPVYTASEVGATTTADVNSLIATAIGEINSFEISIVQSLPTEDIDTHTIYFISNNGIGTNVYDEYMYINNNWEKIGTTNIDLSNYLQTTDIAAWAKAATKPTYTASEVGALPSTYTAPVTSVNGQTGAVTLTIPAAQVQSDWNATSGMGVILNKPTIPAAYDDTALANRVTALENIPWVTYYTGTSEPSSATGSNGDIYLQTAE